MGFPGAHNVRRNPQGLGVARDVTAPQIDVLHGRLAANHPSHFGDAPLGTHRQKELELNIVRVPKCETGAVRSIQDRTVLDTQGIESCWPGFEFFSTRATKGDVVESDSEFIEHVALTVLPVLVDCEHRLKPDRRSKAVLVHDRAGRRPEEALVPLDAPPEVGHGQGVMAERRKRGHSLTLGIPDSHARIRRLGTPKCWRLRFARFCPAISHRPAGRSDSFAYTVRLREHRRTPGGVDVSDALTMWREVAAGFDRRLANVGVDEWTAPTCCPEWTVSQLVEHAIGSQRFVPKALGASGDIDAEGDDLVEVWKTVRAAADQAFAAPGAMDRVVTLPFGEMPAREGLGFPTGDLLVHTWDLARSIGADDRLDAEACTVTYANLAPIDGHIRAPGFFGPKLEPAPDADAQDRLLAFVGRQV